MKLVIVIARRNKVNYQDYPELKRKAPKNMIRIRKRKIKIENKLNSDLGYLYWKKYIAGAFWANISTPINLTITILTAIMSGQATTNNLIPQNIYINISITLT